MRSQRLKRVYLPHFVSLNVHSLCSTALSRRKGQEVFESLRLGNAHKSRCFENVAQSSCQWAAGKKCRKGATFWQSLHTGRRGTKKRERPCENTHQEKMQTRTSLDPFSPFNLFELKGALVNVFSDRHEQAAFDRWQAVRESCAGVWRNEDSHSSAGPRCDNARSVCLLLCLMCHCSSWGDSEKEVQVVERNNSTREKTKRKHDNWGVSIFTQTKSHSEISSPIARCKNRRITLEFFSDEQASHRSSFRIAGPKGSRHRVLAPALD